MDNFWVFLMELPPIYAYTIMGIAMIIYILYRTCVTRFDCADMSIIQNDYQYGRYLRPQNVPFEDQLDECTEQLHTKLVFEDTPMDWSDAPSNLSIRSNMTLDISQGIDATPPPSPPAPIIEPTPSILQVSPRGGFVIFDDAEDEPLDPASSSITISDTLSNRDDDFLDEEDGPLDPLNTGFLSKSLSDDESVKEKKD